MKKCPKCGSKRVAPILYGYPLYDEEMQKAIADEKLYLGGCCISDVMPKYHCYECKRDFGTPPVLVGKKGTEDYRDIVTELRFRDGGYFIGHMEISISNESGKRIIEVTSSFRRPDLFLHREMTDEEWKTLLQKLYGRMYLHEWKKHYRDSRMIVMDGEQWELELKLKGGRTRSYYGDNVFPPYWSSLKAAFRPFIKEAEAGIPEQ